MFSPERSTLNAKAVPIGDALLTHSNTLTLPPRLKLMELPKLTPELTLRQLRCIAAEKQVEGYSRMNKDQLKEKLAELERDALIRRFALFAQP